MSNHCNSNNQIIKDKGTNGKLLTEKSNKRFESTMYNSYGKVAHSDRYRSQSKGHKPSVVNEQKNLIASVKLDSAKKRTNSNNKYKAVFALGLSRRKKRKH